MRPQGLALLYIVTLLTKPLCCADCTQEFNLNVDDVGQKLIDHVIITREQISLARCARECGHLASCLSFNYEKMTRMCQLNSANRDTAGIADFLQDPAFIYSDITQWPQPMFGHCSTKPCGPRQTCVPYQSYEYMCLPLGPASCSMLKQCSPDSGDGEYWIYPALLSDKIRVYCHNMTSDAPKEYLTLVPGINSASNAGGDSRWDHVKHINFERVALNLMDMSITADDFTFSDDDGRDNRIKFGVAAGCPNLGSMDINTAGTGLILDPTITWVPQGYNAYISHFSRSDDGITVSARCSGWCGWCEPDGPLKLQLNTNEVVPQSSATEVICT